MSHGGDPIITVATIAVGGAAVWTGTYAGSLNKGMTHEQACHKATHKLTEVIHHVGEHKVQEARLDAMRKLYT
ncbi:MAG TPA: hypothetical protein DDW76_25885 [Cyanobacteria bacterium UBA11369]|nr:hypothetical protein [Cyanobacteria bacterium UBA11371]HBE19187.1 hypothetical protein [Cyanobacteria bacterium UBA11367]HBE34910.1 hypothetical protein [Cyanobacteria bacterium UBA11368]HBE52107.1 hypothetical protein [Cyanobacteria bacterium UBA11369]